MTQTSDPKADVDAPVQLKDPVLAGLLAWLIPGLGHLYQGRWAKGVLFFVCIMGTFLYGLYLGSDPEFGWGRVVYASWEPEDRHPYYFCQIGVGLPALPALVQAIRVRGGKAPLGTFMAPPKGHTLDAIHRRLARYFQLGEVFTAIAGLLNVLAILDACAGPVPPGKREEHEDKKKDGEDQDKDENADPAQPERAATDDNPPGKKDSR
jgi:hypothetical protein